MDSRDILFAMNEYLTICTLPLSNPQYIGSTLSRILILYYKQDKLHQTSKLEHWGCKKRHVF